MAFLDKSRVKTLRKLLLAAGLILLVMHTLSVLLPQDLSLFDLDNERNVPTFYTGFLLACSALFSFLSIRLATSAVEKYVWALLAGLYLYLSFDEILIVHERFAEPIRDLLSIANNNPFYHAWVIPAIGITVALALLVIALKTYSKIGKHLTKIIILTIILAGGVITLEVIGTQLYFSNTVYKLGPVLLEEMLELGMISLILYNLVDGFAKYGDVKVSRKRSKKINKPASATFLL